MRAPFITAVIGLQLCLGACSSEQSVLTQVIVAIDAEPALREQTSKLRVTIRGSDAVDKLAASSRAHQDTVEPDFPVRIPIAPLGGNAMRVFLLEVTSTNGDGEVLAVTRLISGYEQDTLRPLELMLEDDCIGVECADPLETCHAGECVSARDDFTVDLGGQVARDAGPRRRDAMVERDAQAAARDAREPEEEASEDAAVEEPKPSCVRRTETCDGVDNDCDDAIDEDFDLNPCGGCAPLEHEPNEKCVVGVGKCEARGVYKCAGTDDTECSATAGEPDADETCNWEDDNCDGTIDEGFPKTSAWGWDCDHDGYNADIELYYGCFRPTVSFLERERERSMAAGMPFPRCPRLQSAPVSTWPDYLSSEHDLDCDDTNPAYHPGAIYTNVSTTPASQVHSVPKDFNCDVAVNCSEDGNFCN